jgi:hypothetical protein
MIAVCEVPLGEFLFGNSDSFPVFHAINRQRRDYMPIPVQKY